MTAKDQKFKKSLTHLCGHEWPIPGVSPTGLIEDHFCKICKLQDHTIHVCFCGAATERVLDADQVEDREDQPPTA